MALVNLLYIDDDPSDCTDDMVCLINDDFANVRADSAKTTQDAIIKLQSSRYEVIIYDVGMDSAEGYPFAQYVKELKPGSVLIGMSCLSGTIAMNRLKLPDWFDEKIATTDLVMYYKTALPRHLERHGILLEKRH